MKLKENLEKKVPHRGIEPACITKSQCAQSGTVQLKTHSATKLSISRSVITCTVQVNPTSLLRQNKRRLYSFMFIDELLYHSSFSMI